MRSVILASFVLVGAATLAYGQRVGGQGIAGRPGGGVAPRTIAPPRHLAPGPPVGARGGAAPTLRFRREYPGMPVREPYRGREPGRDYGRHGANGRSYGPWLWSYGVPYQGYYPWLDGYDPGFDDSTGESGAQPESDEAQSNEAPESDYGPYANAQPPLPEQYPYYPQSQDLQGYYPGAPRAPYLPSAQRPSNPPAGPAITDRQAPVTVIFKDGRPPEQIRNYLLTGSTLFVEDGKQQRIPVSQIDVVATEKANKDAGVAFELPHPQN